MSHGARLSQHADIFSFNPSKGDPGPGRHVLVVTEPRGLRLEILTNPPSPYRLYLGLPSLSGHPVPGELLQGGILTQKHDQAPADSQAIMKHEGENFYTTHNPTRNYQLGLKLLGVEFVI